MQIWIKIAAAILLIASGTVHGVWTHRWSGEPALLQEMGKRLNELPQRFGDWTGADLIVTKEQLQIAEASGILSRRYTNAATGDTVQLMIVCGSAGPVSLHPPTVCFTGAGLIAERDPAICRVPRENVQEQDFFQVVDFSGPQANVPVGTRAYWTWFARGRWRAPQNPRIEFANEEVLFKLYLVRTLGNESVPFSSDPCLSFFALIRPELEKLISTADPS
jgi:hypothetical protein